MTQDEIIEMAIQGHASTRDAIRWAMNQEREACAKLAQETICDTHIPTGVNIYGTCAAKAIRARGEKA